MVCTVVSHRRVSLLKAHCFSASELSVHEPPLPRQRSLLRSITHRTFLSPDLSVTPRTSLSRPKLVHLRYSLLKFVILALLVAMSLVLFQAPLSASFQFIFSPLNRFRIPFVLRSTFTPMLVAHANRTADSLTSHFHGR